MLNCSAGVTTLRDILYNFTIYRGMNNFITLGWSTHSPSLRLGSSSLALSVSESRLLHELIDLYESTVGWYDIFETINTEYEQMGHEHSKRAFMEWAKVRRLILMDQHERQVSSDVWE